MNKCSHDFIKFYDKEPADSACVVVCVYCGQVRHIYPEGKIEIIKDYGEVTWQVTYKGAIQSTEQ